MVHYRFLSIIMLVVLLLAVLAIPGLAVNAAVSQALAAAGGDDVTASKDAISRLANVGPDAVAELISLLGNNDHPEAPRVLHGLAVYVSAPGSSAAFRDNFNRVICRELGSGKPVAVNEILIQQLHISGGDDVVQTLAGLLDSHDLHETARQALVAIGTPTAAASLRSALSASEPQRRVGLIQALGLLSDSRGVDTLIEATKSESEDDRIAAVEALGCIGVVRAESAIRGFLYSGSQLSRRTAGAAYLKLADKLAGSRGRAYQGVLDPKATAVEMYKRVALASHDAGIRRNAEERLSELGAEE